MSKDLFSQILDYARRAADAPPRPPTVAYGFQRGDERFYLCAWSAECLEVAIRHDDRMPLTQGDLRVESVIFPDAKIVCENCGAELTVTGPDPRD